MEDLELLIKRSHIGFLLNSDETIEKDLQKIQESKENITHMIN